MLRKILILSACLALAACGQSYTPNGGPYAMRFLRQPRQDGSNQSFSYDHALSVTMPRGSISPRFERARDACLKDASLGCTLISASFNQSEGEDSSVYGELDVALPHANIAKFEKSLLAPIGGETPGAATVTARSTSAENVTQQASDSTRKLAQLTDYRDRLAVLAKRPTLSVDDTIKIDVELSKAQSELDDAKAKQSDVAGRIAKERVSISLGETPEAGDAFRPVGRAWEDGVQIFGDSLASALRFLIGVVPWLPIILGVFFLARWLWRVARRKPAAGS